MWEAMKFFFKRGKILVLIVAGIILILSLNFFQTEVKGFFYNISSPIQKTFLRAGDSISEFFGSVADIQNLKKENDELKSVVRALLAENVLLEELARENEILREALGIGLRDDFQLVLAEITGKDISQESIVIDQGSKDGLAPGMPVVTQEKILLGRIAEVYDNFSRVILISNKESSFDAKISGADVTGVARGRGGSKMEFDLVPQDKNIAVGDLLVSSALGGIYPEGLLAGSVKAVERDDVSPFYRIEILPSFNLQEIETVFVIINSIND